MAMFRTPVRIVVAAMLAAVVVQPGASSAAGPKGESSSLLSRGRTFSEQDGAGLYANICRGCHMDDGRGAAGAGRYPALAGDRNLEAPEFAADIVLHGARAMPAFGRSMTDDQIAAVVNYVRTHFGNSSGVEITPAEVQSWR